MEHCQGLQAQEVELHEPCGLNQLPVVLGDKRIRFRVECERDQLNKRPVGDHHAGCVRRRVAVEPLELLGNLEQPRNKGIGALLFLQFWLTRDGLGQSDGISRIIRHELTKTINLAVGDLQDTTDVAQHRACLQFAVRNDLGHAVVPIFVLHVADDFVAAVLAKVDIEVGHRHAFGIEESLKKQTEPQWIKVRNGEGPSDERARA